MKKKKEVRGRKLSIKNLLKKKPGDKVWVFYCKDDNPEYLRLDEPVEILEINNEGKHKYEVRACEGDWNIDKDTDLKDNSLDTSRGFSYFFEVNHTK